MTQPLAIAIVGAGPAGLAAASFLKRDGHEVTMFERFAAPHPIGAGLLLQPTGLAMLAALGLDRQAIAAASPIRHLYGRVGPRGRVVFDIHYGDLAPGLFGLGIHRGTLFSLLYDKALALGVPIRTDTAIAALEYRQGKPVLTDQRGAAHGPFDLVVDAQGSRSVLRAPAGMRLNRPYPYGAVWGTLRDEAGAFAADTLAQRYQRARHMIGVLPLGRLNGESCQSVAFFWSLRVADYPAWVDAGIVPWREQVIRLWPETETLLRQVQGPQDLTLATYSDVLLRRPYGAGIAFIGDSAHCTSPQLGQGANLALIDAFTLADALRRRDTVEAALTDYGAARHRHVRFYQTASRWLTPFFQSDSRIMPLVRDLTYGPLCRIPYLRTEMLRTLTGVKTGLFSHLDPEAWTPDSPDEPVASLP